MPEKWPQTVVTASAWVLQGDVFPFMIGPDHTGDYLGVVRLGGHIEPGETPWECATREVREEAGLDIEASVPPATYRLRQDSLCPVQALPLSLPLTPTGPRLLPRVLQPMDRGPSLVAQPRSSNGCNRPPESAQVSLRTTWMSH